LLTAIVIFLIFSSIVAVLWVGSHDVMNGQITAGRLSQFLLYAALAAGALSELSQVWGDVSAASGASERLFEILRLKPAIVAPASPRTLPNPSRGEVSFRNVRFAYPTRPGTDVVDGISFAVKAGEKVAIVGPSGAGKSTLFHLLLRFYDPNSGTILFDGIDVCDADPRDVRSRVTLVPQEPVIFATNVRENIRFGRPDADDAEVESAANLAHAAEFIQRLPHGCRNRTRRARRHLPEASVSVSPLQGPSCATRLCYCSMKRPRLWTRKARRWCRQRWKS
jgi:ATP-binding cassette subfamily B protein